MEARNGHVAVLGRNGQTWGAQPPCLSLQAQKKEEYFETPTTQEELVPLWTLGGIASILGGLICISRNSKGKEIQ